MSDAENELDTLPTRLRNARTLKEPYALQLVMFGAILADKEIRDLVEAQDFLDTTIGASVKELKDGNPKSGYPNLKEVMRRLGIIWDKSQGTPTDAAIERLKIDADFDRAVRVINNMVHRLDDPEKSKEQKLWTIERLQTAKDRMDDLKEGKS